MKYLENELIIWNFSEHGVYNGRDAGVSVAKGVTELLAD